MRKDSDTINKIENLSNLTGKVSSLTVADRLELVNELIRSLQEMNEWTFAGNWIREEMKSRQIKLSTTATLTTEEQQSASNLRFGVALNLSGYLNTLKISLEYELSTNPDSNTSNVKKPELLSKVRTENTPEGSVQVYGPMPILTGGPTFEAWCEPASTSTNDKSSTDSSKDGIALVLGAGNFNSLSLIDTLHSFFIHPRKPVLLKHHPLCPFLHHPFVLLFQPLIQRGYVDHIYDQGLEHTQVELLKNELVQHVHVTGSYFTSVSIKEYMVKERKDVTSVKAEEMVTSELGCSSPWIVSPGVYEETELKNAAKLIAQAKKAAGGTFCLAAQVLILPEQFPQKEALLSYLSNELSTQRTEPCYYPGSINRCQSIVQHYKELSEDRIVTTKAPLQNQILPDGENSQVTMVKCGKFGSESYDDKALKMEAFGPVLAIVDLPQDSKQTDEQYLLETALPFVNNKSNIFGSLSGVILKPNTMAESTITKAVGAMKYGTVAVNAWSVLGYVAMLKGAVWGGHQRDGVGHSGNGYVGNVYNIQGIEKTVVYGPSLMKEPDGLLPTIVMDVIVQVVLSKTNFRALVNVWILLVIRVLTSFLPMSLLKGKGTYGAAF